MIPPRFATLISNQDRQFIDHLAPLAEKLNIPLIVNDQEIESLIQTYYPHVAVIYQHTPNLGLYLTQNFEIVYTCLPTPLFRQLVFIAELTLQKTLFNVWCPHGNSDKGHQKKHIEYLFEERFALVYGQQLIDLLIEKGSFNQLEGIITTGNYRLKHYQKHKTFYQNTLNKRINLNPNKTVLYAPTWKDQENSSSLETAFKPMLANLPDHLNLIIKPHPNSLSSFTPLLHSIPKKKNVLLLPDFPPVYPLLDLVDIYLGDMSSIGYDFLSFRKPLFFLNTNQRNPKEDKGLYLTQCGTLIEPEDYPNIFSIIEHTDPSPFENNQKKLYGQVFGIEENFKEKVIQAYGKQLQDA